MERCQTPAVSGRSRQTPPQTVVPNEVVAEINRSARRRLARRFAVTLVAGLFALIFGATGIANAHSGAVSSVPEDGSSIEAGPARASITFNEELQQTFPSLTVVGPDGRLWSKGKPVVEGRTVSVEVGELGPVGEYTMAFRVTSADGHPVSGTRTFTLTEEGTGTPGAKPGEDEGSDGEESGGVPVWVFVAGGVVLFGVGLAVALLGTGRKK